MSRYPAALHFLLLLACIAFSATTLSAQTPEPAQAAAAAQPAAPAPINMEEEHHHHLVFENAYIRAFYVEIPAHESTLYHRHDLPYINLPPPPSAAAPSAAPASAGSRQPSGPRVSYSLGSFSHTVTNSTDLPLRNIAVELLRPQGTVRNRCMEAVRLQPLGDCDRTGQADPSRPFHYTLFETDEILVEYWEVGPNSTVTPSDPHLSSLWGGASGIVEGVANGDSRPVPQAGLAWLLPGSRTAFKTGPAPGHFALIVFKDSAPQP